jgi:hypothetical protein
LSILAWSFGRWLRCSLVADHCGYAPRSRLASGQNPRAIIAQVISSRVLTAQVEQPHRGGTVGQFFGIDLGDGGFGDAHGLATTTIGMSFMLMEDTRNGKLTECLDGEFYHSWLSNSSKLEGRASIISKI